MRGPLVNAFAAEPDVAGGRPKKAGYRINNCRLPGTVRTDESDDLPRLHGETDSVDGDHPAEAYDKVLDTEGGLPHRSGLRHIQPNGMGRKCRTRSASPAVDPPDHLAVRAGHPVRILEHHE